MGSGSDWGLHEELAIGSTVTESTIMRLHFPLTEEAGKKKSDVLLKGRDNE